MAPLERLDPFLYGFNEAGLLPFGSSAAVRAMTGNAIRTLARRDMAFLLTNQTHWPRLARCQRPIPAAALIRIWRVLLSELLFRTTSGNDLDCEMQWQQERRLVAMLGFLSELENDLE